MDYLEAFAITAGVAIAGLGAFLVRRITLLRGGGTVEMSLRLYPDGQHGRGWALGVGRFVGDELQWFRTFSLSPRPKRVLSRHDLSVTGRRRPIGGESLALMSGSIVLACTNPTGPVDLAMTEAAETGFLSWLESAPPGSGFGRRLATG
ncbi:MAG TPA: DUF2550 domain-containing protein [Mycobacteriales bacterium]|jgi:hypothetical protein|nr:hypothetical protein [Mycobacterium sp.]